MRTGADSSAQHPRPSSEDRMDDLPLRFKQLYFHLYSNSNSSRAETLLADLSLLLLCKLLSENASPDRPLLLDDFLGGVGRADEVLLPALCAAYPHLVDASDRFHLSDAS